MMINKTSMKPVSWREGHTQSGQPLDTLSSVGGKELEITPPTARKRCWWGLSPILCHPLTTKYQGVVLIEYYLLSN